MQIEVGPESVTLRAPGSVSTAMAIVRLIEVSPEWAGGAAFALCAPEVAKTAGVAVRYDDLPTMGREMYDWLVGRLMKTGRTGMQAMAAATEACTHACNCIIAELPLEAEVEAVGND